MYKYYFRPQRTISLRFYSSSQKSLPFLTRLAHIPRPAAYSFLGTALALTLYISFYSPTNQSLSQERFTPATIVSSIPSPSDPSSKLVTVSISPHILPKTIPTPIWSVFIKDHDLQIERPFTPVSGISCTQQILFWVRQYPDGEVGRWLCQQPVGATIELRGPIQTLDWLKEDAKWDHIVMISGGTGITPFAQLLNHLFSGPATFSTRLTLLHSSQSPAELPPRDVLHPLLQYAKQYPEQFQVRLFVDRADSDAKYQDLRVGRIGILAIKDALHYQQSRRRSQSLFSPNSSNPINRTLILVCGPDSMICAIAGPRNDDFSPGPLGGILRDMGFSSSNVRKL